MKRMIIYILLLSIHLALGHANGERQNLQLVVISTSRSTETYVENLINAIPERKYRLALMINSVPVYDFLKFPEKQCAMKKMKKNKYHRNVQDPLCCSLNKLKNHRVKINDILLITDQKLSDRELTCAVTHYKDHRPNMYIVERDPFADEVMTYRIHAEHNHTRVSFTRDRYTALPFVRDKSMECRGHEPVYQYDECGRRCLCINGMLTQCYRMRKEFSRMTFKERLRYIKAYWTISTTQPFKKEFDRVVDIHRQVFLRYPITSSTGLHKWPQFLPFHRRYLLGFEDLLRQVDCRVTLPVWNWARHSPHVWGTRPDYHMWDVIGGFGGNGTAPDYCVRSGQFQKGLWMTSYEEHWQHVEKNTRWNLKTNGYKHGFTEKFDPEEDEIEEHGINKGDGEDEENSHEKFSCEPLHPKNKTVHPLMNSSHNCLRRGFSCLPPDLQRVTDYLNCLQPSQFKMFHSFLTLWHNRIHNCTLGQMDTVYTSHTPEFWLHHAMIDALWDNWQRRGPAFKYQPIYFNDSLFLVGFPRDLAENFVDNDALDDCVRIAYPNVLGDKKRFDDHHKMPKVEDYEQWCFGNEGLFDFTEEKVQAMKRHCEKENEQRN